MFDSLCSSEMICRPIKSARKCSFWLRDTSLLRPLQFHLQVGGAAHPGFGPDAPEPVGGCRDTPQVLLDVLLADPSRGDDSTATQGDRLAEHLLAGEDTLRVVPQGPVPEVGQQPLGV